jgi:hypothetical protein
LTSLEDNELIITVKRKAHGLASQPDGKPVPLLGPTCQRRSGRTAGRLSVVPGQHRSAGVVDDYPSRNTAPEPARSYASKVRVTSWDAIARMLDVSQPFCDTLVG